MKRYIRPEIVVADQLAEGINMMSGDNPVALSEALDAAIEGGEGIENNDADDMTGSQIAEGPDGDILAGEGVLGENETSDTESEIPSDLTPDTAEDTIVTDTAEANEDANASSEETLADGALQESGQMQGSMRISCDSKYMDGVWQGPKNGAWGDLKLGCKEVWGCKDCPADKGNGCGLQDSNAVSLYFHKMGSLMPGWEASGKLPTDSPYGF